MGETLRPVARSADVRHWDDLGYTVVLQAEAEYADTRAKFRVYEIVAREVTETRNGERRSFTRGYQRANAVARPDPVEHWDNAEVFLSGLIRWDGCSDWDFIPLHFCERETAEQIGTLFGRLYAWARELGMDRD